ncbi:YaiI/YqxD family protein [Youngiibacter fragilis]|uniref:UPF0178 protein T472_0205065 n=1 Tax=Youngiibacter fragilis 232.1 TaxID=994573 RepID=V7I931_9CLOT|nr:DUF188 domain-containing protein [Youngiibacter fragilis]ETA81769.1 hypothetical protein T472_0205065 [Youngiibacter fragilis 232.1]
MKIYIDADGCPVAKLSVEIAKKYGIGAVIVKNYAHEIADDYAQIVTVDISSDSADLAIANMVRKGDILVTQDYGLAAMAMTRGANCINQNGLVMDERNIDNLLDKRHVSRKMRRDKKIYTKIPKRTLSDDESFKDSLVRLIERLSGKL